MSCRWSELLLAIVIIVFTQWNTAFFSAAISKWIVIVAAAVLVVHSLLCHKCHGLFCSGIMTKGTSGRRSRRRRR